MIKLFCPNMHIFCCRGVRKGSPDPVYKIILDIFTAYISLEIRENGYLRCFFFLSFTAPLHLSFIALLSGNRVAHGEWGNERFPKCFEMF